MPAVEGGSPFNLSQPESLMRLISKLSVSMFALALTIGFSTQAMAADKGTIKGSVTGTDGKPAAAGISVRVTAPGGPGGPGGKKPAAQAAGTTAPQALADRPAGGNRPAPVAEAKTDDKGEFTVEVPAGEYVVRAGSRDAGMGVSDKVTVEAGKTAEVKITLKARAAK